MEAQQLDRQSLLAALEGKLSTLDDELNFEPVSCQEVIFSGNAVSHIKIEGLGTIQVPIPFHVSISHQYKTMPYYNKTFSASN